MSALLKKIVSVIEPHKFDAKKYGRKHTPDILQLQQRKRHLVFLPCDMQKGRRNHSFLSDPSTEPYGLGYTRRKFVMYTKQLGNESFPIALPGAEERTYFKNRLNPQFAPESACVKGELYFVNTETLSEKLDNYKLNGVEFTREMVEVRQTYHEPYQTTDRDTGQPLIMFTDERVFIHKAWMYVGVEDYWYQHLDAGYVFKPTKLAKVNKKWLHQCYEFK